MKTPSARTLKAQRILMDRAKARDVITYGALADMIGMNPWHIGPVLNTIHRLDKGA